ncbi:MAG: DUF126 domain-containing protein [Candidatus Diapherotrites archaeon]|nr:DUF126 domain-containing protein [Candidatus Diapherotrites archaeon]
MKLKGRAIMEGIVEGEALVSEMPIGFYGKVDTETGIIHDEGHDLDEECLTEKILIFPKGKGSTVGSFVIYGLEKKKTGPKAIINAETEPIVATGVIIADLPCVDRIDISKIKTGDWIKVNGETGEVEVNEQ